MKLIPRKLLRLYQKFMVSLVKKIPYILLALDMGLGKTIIVLTALRDLFDKVEINKVLIVAPLFVAENTWPNEIKGWEHTQVMSYSVVTGDEDERIAALRKDVDIYIINKENLPWMYDYFRKIYVRKVAEKNKGIPKSKWDQSGISPIPFDVAVIDEASMLKSGNARTTKDEKKFEREKAEIENRTDIDEKEKKKLIKQIEPSYSRTGVLYKMRPVFKRVIELSGTPSPNGLHDLWGLIYLLDAGIRLGTAKTNFLKRYFNQDIYTRKYELHEHSFSMIMNKLKDVMFSLNADDWIELPERIDNKIYVEFSDKEKRQYKEFKKTFYAEDFDVEAVNSGVLTNKLLQFCNGSIYNENREVLPVHSKKIEALKTLVNESLGSPILIFYAYEFDRDLILKTFPNAKYIKDVKDVENKWNNGEIEILVAHPTSAGHGLNLQKGEGHTCIWYGLCWSLEFFRQGIKRLHRSGQKNKVVNHFILVKNTVDDVVLETLMRKGAVQDDVTEAVRVDVFEGAI